MKETVTYVMEVELRADGYYEAVILDAGILRGPAMVGVARSRVMAMGFALQKYGNLYVRMFPSLASDYERTAPK